MTAAVIEAAAAGLALLYLLLAIRESRACWFAAAASAGLYLWVFWEARLLMEAALQGFYIVAAGYGWWFWGSADGSAPIRRWPGSRHFTVIAGILGGALLSGWLMARHTDAALPYLDATTTVAALVTTWMVARKVLENWLYWIVIDSLSIYLYIERNLAMTAVLFAGYVVLAAAGYLEWRRHYTTQKSHPA